ncbi:hypothetical protein [Paenibacillus brevis]|uniref:Secreted protein n=1 Tax=Paenibacillus brevis TaxID=2841508 RepID=A0ABS6FYV8_9BACL|nr:hypothetical protein [Paenibacillus brevis]MBU5674310.1 hypothetical protein [Paenibacillus brevis]
MIKIKKLSIMTLLAVFLLSVGATSAFADLSNYESEPNNYYDTADVDVRYDMDKGTNYGYLTTGDLDYWHLLTNNARYYNISLLAPLPYLEYNVVVLERIPGQEGYTEVGRSFSINGVAGITVPGIKNNGVIPDYYAVVYCNNGFHNTETYKLIINPIY